MKRLIITQSLRRSGNPIWHETSGAPIGGDHRISTARKDVHKETQHADVGRSQLHTFVP